MLPLPFSIFCLIRKLLKTFNKIWDSLLYSSCFSSLCPFSSYSTRDFQFSCSGHWRDWCWSWNSNTLSTWCEELTHLKRPWCWERLRAGGEGEDRGWDGWMASPTQWTWVWVDSGSWSWTGRPVTLRFMGSQRVGHDRVTELNWCDLPCTLLLFHPCIERLFFTQLLLFSKWDCRVTFCVVLGTDFFIYKWE